MLIRFWCFFFQAEDGIRDLVRSRGLGDVYKRQIPNILVTLGHSVTLPGWAYDGNDDPLVYLASSNGCLLYTSDAADERSSVDLGGRSIIKKKNTDKNALSATIIT